MAGAAYAMSGNLKYSCLQNSYKDHNQTKYENQTFVIIIFYLMDCIRLLMIGELASLYVTFISYFL